MRQLTLFQNTLNKSFSMSPYLLLWIMNIIFLQQFYFATAETQNACPALTNDTFGFENTCDLDDRFKETCLEWFRRIVCCSNPNSPYCAGQEIFNKDFVHCITSGEAYWWLVIPCDIIRSCFSFFGNKMGEDLVTGFSLTLQKFVLKLRGYDDCWGAHTPDCPVPSP